MYSIATRMNKAGMPAFVGKNGWHRSYLAKTLANRAVLGEFQPHIKVEGKRVPQGEPIKHYFPAIVPEDLFFRAQHSKSQRRVSGSGRKGVGYTNLFTGLARCAYCKSIIAFENKGASARGGTYLVCDSAQRGRGCSATRWRYKDFEATFLAFVRELDLESIVNANEDAEKRRQLEDELSSLRGELSVVADLMEKTYAVLSAGGSPEFVAGKLNELTARQSSLRKHTAKKEAEQQEFNARDSRFYESREEIRDLVRKLQMPPSGELYKVRAQIASRLKLLVRTLLIGPEGNVPTLLRSIEHLKRQLTEEADELIAHMQKMAADPAHSSRFFVVGFRDASLRVVFPTRDDPLQFKQQIVGRRGVDDGKTSIDYIAPSGEQTSLITAAQIAWDQDVPDELDR
jgi:hypothetical protein